MTTINFKTERIWRDAQQLLTSALREELLIRAPTKVARASAIAAILTDEGRKLDELASFSVEPYVVSEREGVDQATVAAIAIEVQEAVCRQLEKQFQALFAHAHTASCTAAIRILKELTN